MRFSGASLAILYGAFICRASASFAACDPVPVPPVNFVSVSPYIDEHHSVIDPAREAQWKADSKPMEDFEKGVARMASDYADKGDSAAAACALDWLSQWASNRAFLGEMGSPQAFYAQKWVLAAAAMSYARVRRQATPAQASFIESWLKSLADRAIEHTEKTPKERNNHYYWTGLAVAAVGAITHEKKYLDFANGVFDNAMDQINEDGSLPLELARANRALGYHIFAAGPLVMMSSILNRNSPKLDQLVAFTFNGMNDPGPVTAKAGVAQNPVEPGAFEWLRVYLRRHSDPRMQSYIATQKHHLVALLGGYLDVPNPLEHATR
jgi:poly(beta-D-mannuronate) lyase